ncbi:MAG: transposase [Planctomycetales bacterium]|nr:transposase [Planctomycetales bacterium]
MGVAKEGDGLEALVRAAVPLCREAERLRPRCGPGRRPKVPDWVLAVLIMATTAKRRKSKSAQYRFIVAHRESLCVWMNVTRLPKRTQYFDRFRRAHRLLDVAVELAGRRAVERGHADARLAAVDKSLIATRGAPWHRRDRRRKHVPRGVDVEATWTYSQHHGWLEGYGYEIVVSAGKNGPVWPLCVSVEPAHVREHRTFPAKAARLPKQVRYVLADSGYDAEDLAEAVESSPAENGRRRFVCPLRKPTRTAKRVWRETRRRRARRERRDRRREWMARPYAKKLYARRAVTVEPFNEWFKKLFDLHEHAWHRGNENNCTQILAAVFTYQLLLAYNRRRKKHHAQIAYILDGL